MYKFISFFPLGYFKSPAWRKHFKVKVKGLFGVWYRPGLTWTEVICQGPYVVFAPDEQNQSINKKKMKDIEPPEEVQTLQTLLKKHNPHEISWNVPNWISLFIHNILILKAQMTVVCLPVSALNTELYNKVIQPYFKWHLVKCFLSLVLQAC